MIIVDDQNKCGDAINLENRMEMKLTRVNQSRLAMSRRGNTQKKCCGESNEIETYMCDRSRFAI
jgi:hypothetical protein